MIWLLALWEMFSLCCVSLSACIMIEHHLKNELIEPQLQIWVIEQQLNKYSIEHQLKMNYLNTSKNIINQTPAEEWWIEHQLRNGLILRQLNKTMFCWLAGRCHKSSKWLQMSNGKLQKLDYNCTWRQRKSNIITSATEVGWRWRRCLD